MLKLLKGIVTALVLVCTAQAIEAKESDSPKYYGFASFGARSVSSEDANKLLDLSILGFSKTNYGNLLPFTISGGFGYHFVPKFAVELGAELGPNRAYETTYLSSGGTSLLKDRLEARSASVYLMPNLNIPSGGIFQKRGQHTIGLRLAASSLAGSEELTNLQTNVSGKVEFDASATGGGFVYRFVDIADSGFGWGLELAYDFARFQTINLKNPSGAVAGSTITNPAKFPNGSQAYWDNSGVSLKLVLGGWGR